MSIKKLVNNLIQNENVIVFSKTYCPYIYIYEILFFNYIYIYFLLLLLNFYFSFYNKMKLYL